MRTLLPAVANSPSETRSYAITVALLESMLWTQSYLPRAAVWREDDESFVRLRRGEDFITRQIEIGVMNAVEVVVAEGLREGDTVALIRARTTADYSQRHERDQSGNSRNRAAASAGGGS